MNELIIEIPKPDDSRDVLVAKIYSDSFTMSTRTIKSNRINNAKDPINAGITALFNAQIFPRRARRGRYHYSRNYNMFDFNIHNDFNLFLHIGALPIVIERKGSRMFLNGLEHSKKSICQVLARLTYKSIFDNSTSTLLSLMHRYLKIPENIRHVMENRFPYYFYERYEKTEVVLNVEQISSDEFAIEISDGLWGTIGTKDLNTMCNSYMFNSKRGNWHDLKPAVLYERLIGKEPSESELKVMKEFLKQNRHGDIVEVRAMELLKEVEIKYPNIKVEYDEENNPKVMYVRGKGYDWQIKPTRYKGGGTQDVQSFVWQKFPQLAYNSAGKPLHDEEGNHIKVISGGNWSGPICIDNLQSGSSLGDQFVARALAFLNDTITVARVHTIKTYLVTEPDTCRNKDVTILMNGEKDEM